MQLDMPLKPLWADFLRSETERFEKKGGGCLLTKEGYVFFLVNRGI